MTLGAFIRNRRAGRSQTEVALAAEVNPSLLSFIEDGKKVRFTTVRAICRKGLKVSDADWSLVKILWLEQQSGEPLVGRPAAAKRLTKLEQRGSTRFNRQVEDCLAQHATLISERNLQPSILAVLGDHRLLRALPDYLRVFQAINEPLPQPSKGD